MSLQVVTSSIQHTGVPSPDEMFEIVLEDGTILVGMAEHVAYPMVGFCLRREDWPAQVTEAYHETLAWLKDEDPAWGEFLDYPPIAWIHTRATHSTWLRAGDSFVIFVRLGGLSCGQVHFTSPIKELRLRS